MPGPTLRKPYLSAHLLSYHCLTPILFCPSLQTVVVYAATKGYMDKVPVNKIVAAEEAVLASVDPRVFKVLKAKGKITPEVDAHIKQQLQNVVFPK